MPQDSPPRNSLHEGGYTLRMLIDSEIGILSSFDCGNADLNDFFRNDCLPHRAQLMAETYVFTEDEHIVALISFSNDSVRLSDAVKRDMLPPEMQYPSVPAVKIARLGVVCGHQGEGIGSLIIYFCKKLFLTNNRTGCRLITVDALNQERVINFYQRHHFEFLSDKDAGKAARIMWYDLKRADIR
jgi:hypothetical protein